jgi:hypothetical protein
VNSRPVACPILVGRDRELETLHEARRGLSRSRSAFVLIGGDAGIGKSRLLAAFVRTVADGRARNIVSVECLEYAPAPFGPIRDAVEQLARSARLTLPPLLARFVARDVPAPTIEKAELFLAIADFFRACARERATIVTIEDIHWGDATTLEFLAYAARGLPDRVCWCWQRTVRTRSSGMKRSRPPSHGCCVNPVRFGWNSKVSPTLICARLSRARSTDTVRSPHRPSPG